MRTEIRLNALLCTALLLPAACYAGAQPQGLVVEEDDRSQCGDGVCFQEEQEQTSGAASDDGASDTSSGADNDESGSSSDSHALAAPDEPAPPSSSRHTPIPAYQTTAPQGYWEYLPPHYEEDAAAGTPAPLLVFWHGLGENGNGGADLTKVAKHGPPQLIESDAWPSARPFVVLSPQHAGGGCPTPQEIDAFLTWAVDNYDVDPGRVYLTGLSCGAIGSWNYLGVHRGELVAAAVLIAGDGRSAYKNAGCDLGEVPLWAFHGDADTTVTVDGTRAPVQSLQTCATSPDASMVIYPGVGHNSWTRTYDLSAGHDVYAWLLEHAM